MRTPTYGHKRLRLIGAAFATAFAGFVAAAPAPAAIGPNEPIHRDTQAPLTKRIAGTGTLAVEAKARVTFRRSGPTGVSIRVTDKASDGWCPVVVVEGVRSGRRLSLGDRPPERLASSEFFCNPAGTRDRTKELRRDLHHATDAVRLTVGRLFCHGYRWEATRGEREYTCPEVLATWDLDDESVTLAEYVTNRPPVKGNPPITGNHACEAGELCLFEHADYRGRVFDHGGSSVPLWAIPPVEHDVSSWSNGSDWAPCAVRIENGDIVDTLFAVSPRTARGRAVSGYSRDGWVGRSNNDKANALETVSGRRCSP